MEKLPAATVGRYALGWTTVIGNRVGGHGWNEASRPVAEAVADSSGHVEFHFTVPDDLDGVHVLSVENGAEKQMGSFWIKPTAFPLDVEHGPPGTPFAVHLKGVGWTETANIYTVVYDNSYIGYVCAQATGDPGWHFIDLYPAIYRGEQQRPRNFSRLTRTVRDAPISAGRDGETASGRTKKLLTQRRSTLAERLERERLRGGGSTRLADRLMEIGRHCTAVPNTDTRSPDEIAGYDETGMWR